MNSENKSLIPTELLEKYSGIFLRYFDRVLLNSSLSNTDALLLCVHIIDVKNKKSGAKYDEVRNLFVTVGRKYENFRKVVYYCKKNELIEIDEKNRIIFLLHKGLKRLWKILGEVGKSKVYIVKAGKRFSAIRLFEEFLEEEVSSNEIFVCDPYISDKTLFPFSVLSGKLRIIRMLTNNISDQQKFFHYKKMFEREYGIKVEIRINKKIHDRFIIAGNKCWHIGTSIKDLGNKDTIIKDLSEVCDSLRYLFEERWNEDEKDENTRKIY